MTCNQIKDVLKERKNACVGHGPKRQQGVDMVREGGVCYT
jgi:hypothetical protein